MITGADKREVFDVGETTIDPFREVMDLTPFIRLGATSILAVSVTGDDGQTLCMRRQSPVATKTQNLTFRAQNTAIQVSITRQPPRISHRNGPLAHHLGPGHPVVGIKGHRHDDGRTTTMPRTRRARAAPHQPDQRVGHPCLIWIAPVTTQHLRPLGMVSLPGFIGQAHQCGT